MMQPASHIDTATVTIDSVINLHFPESLKLSRFAFRAVPVERWFRIKTESSIVMEPKLSVNQKRGLHGILQKLIDEEMYDRAFALRHHSTLTILDLGFS
jgi:hypothetical protein